MRRRHRHPSTHQERDEVTNKKDFLVVFFVRNQYIRLRNT